jgi:hypothetical protein
LFTLLAEATTAGSWCAAVGLPGLGLVCAAEAGVALERFALVPHPGPDWVDTVGALLDGLDIVAVATPASVTPTLATRVAARVRNRGAVLIAMGAWPGADITLEVSSGTWHGLGEGMGRLCRREIEVVASGRGAAARSRRARLWLPGSTGVPALATATNTTTMSDLTAASGTTTMSDLAAVSGTTTASDLTVMTDLTVTTGATPMRGEGRPVRRVA